MTDILDRTIGQALTEPWRQPVIVENIPGAGGGLGADRVAKTRPDGYRLRMGHIGTLAVTPSLDSRPPPTAPVQSLAAAAWVARVQDVLAIHSSLPVKTLAESRHPSST